MIIVYHIFRIKAIGKLHKDSREKIVQPTQDCLMLCGTKHKIKEGKMPSVICLQGRLYDTCKRPPLYNFCGMWCGLSRLPASTLTLRFRPLASLCVPVLLRHIPSEGGNARVCQFRH